jgi:two-component system response regulator YesN
MGPSLTEAKHFRFGKKDFPHDLRQIKCQKVTTALKHRMAAQKTLDLIGGRIQDPPQLCELACLAGLSRTYFSPVFKEVVGMGLQDYLICARINKAKDLLGDINLTIKKIAYEVGFRDPNHFSRTFKKKTGATPTDWRLAKVETSLKRGSFIPKLERRERK